MDFNTVAEKLAYIQQMQLPFGQCSLEQLLGVISFLRIPGQFKKDSESVSDSDSDSDSQSSSRPDDEQLLPSLAGLAWRHLTPNTAPGQSMQLPPISIGSMHAVSIRFLTRR
jgi:hypothetical protein